LISVAVGAGRKADCTSGKAIRNLFIVDHFNDVSADPLQDRGILRDDLGIGYHALL